MELLSISELNTVAAVLGAFTFLFGIFSAIVKHRWFLGEALPALLVGIVLGPVAARLLDSTRWGPGSLDDQQKSAVTLGLMRVMITTQLVGAGYQLPARFAWNKVRSLLVCLFPVMTVMWLSTTCFVLAAISAGLSLPSALVVAACVTPTDPILSQAVAKGPFADKYIARPLREIMSAEAGANDGFASPMLMLAVYLMRHSELGPGHVRPQRYPGTEEAVGRLGGGPGVAVRDWFVETWCYTMLLAIVYGVVVGSLVRVVVSYCLRRKWIDTESYLLFPSALALFTTGTVGTIGSSDILASFVAGMALNWDGEYLRESEARHDEVNSSIDVLLNLYGFMYIGAVMPWSQFHDPAGTGVTLPRLLALGALVLLFRRIPCLLMFYKTMPSCVANWKEALLMGYFGPIGAGAIFYAETAKHLYPLPADADPGETRLLDALTPAVYFLTLCSIVVHGASVPALNLLCERRGVEPVKGDAVQRDRRSLRSPLPPNADEAFADRGRIIAYNRFSRPPAAAEDSCAAVDLAGQAWLDDLTLRKLETAASRDGGGGGGRV